MQKINNGILKCTKCKSVSNVKNLTFGNNKANILIINDYATDDKSQKEYFYYLLDNSNVDKNDIAYINAVNCVCKRKDGNNRLPSLEEVNNCKIFTQYLISKIQPRVIVLMGATSLNQFTQDHINLIKNVNKSTSIFGIKALTTYSVRDIYNLQEIDESKADEAIESIIDTFNKANEYIKILKEK